MVLSPTELYYQKTSREALSKPDIMARFVSLNGACSQWLFQGRDKCPVNFYSMAVVLPNHLFLILAEYQVDILYNETDASDFPLPSLLSSKKLNSLPRHLLCSQITIASFLVQKVLLTSPHEIHMLGFRVERR